MSFYHLKPCAIVVSIALSSLAQAQDKADEKWFPELPVKPMIQKQSQVDMPSIVPYQATSCSGNIRTFETPGSKLEMQLKARGDLSARMAAPPSPAPGGAFAPAAPVAMAKSMSAEKAERSAVTAIHTDVASEQRRNEPLRAGFVDDNADYSGFLAFLAKKESIAKGYRVRDVSERHGIDVRDALGQPVQGAVISMKLGSNDTKTIAVSDVNGKAWVFPKAITTAKGPYTVTVQLNGGASKTVQIAESQKSRTLVQLDDTTAKTIPRLDLSIVIDTTGSMSDEIRKLQSTLTKVVGAIEKQGVDVCLNVTAYRDVEDDYILKGIDFTSNFEEVQTFVNGLRADGGGDEPEALNQALEHVVNKLSWRKQDNVVRSVMLITDAPPKMNTAPVFYDRSMLAAGAHGVRVHSVGTSGLNVDGGELVLRQVAQYTGGKFVFLTYKDAANPSKGAGDATVHSVENYSTDTLDALLLRLVKDDLGVKSSK